MGNWDLPPRYRAYLLRCWEERGEQDDGGTVWRFSLVNPETNERRGFATPEALAAFLTRLVDEESLRDEAGEDDGRRAGEQGQDGPRL